VWVLWKQTLRRYRALACGTGNPGAQKDRESLPKEWIMGSCLSLEELCSLVMDTKAVWDCVKNKMFYEGTMEN
jgi:hypothetical protein